MNDVYKRIDSLNHILDSEITVKLLVEWLHRNCFLSLSSRPLAIKHIPSDSNCIFVLINNCDVLLIAIFVKKFGNIFLVLVIV